MLSWGPCWAKTSPHIFLLIFRRTVNRWKQLLYFCSLANSWIPGDIPGDIGLLDSAHPPEDSPYKPLLTWLPLVIDVSSQQYDCILSSTWRERSLLIKLAVTSGAAGSTLHESPWLSSSPRVESIWFPASTCLKLSSSIQNRGQERDATWRNPGMNWWPDVSVGGGNLSVDCWKVLFLYCWTISVFSTPIFCARSDLGSLTSLL